MKIVNTLACTSFFNEISLRHQMRLDIVLITMLEKQEIKYEGAAPRMLPHVHLVNHDVENTIDIVQLVCDTPYLYTVFRSLCCSGFAA